MLNANDLELFNSDDEVTDADKEAIAGLADMSNKNKLVYTSNPTKFQIRYERWLESLSVGDEVEVFSMSDATSILVLKISEVNEHRVKSEGGTSFIKYSGYQVKSGNSINNSVKIFPIGFDVKKVISRNKYIATLCKDVQYYDMTDEQLEILYKLVKQFKA